jgi:predicted PurR-regulated permease PerM
LTAPLPANLLEPAPDTVTALYTRFVTVALSGVLLLATLYTLYFASDFAIPVVAAVILGLVFAPFIRRLARIGIPSAISGALVVLTVVGGLSAGIVVLSDSATQWLNRAPIVLNQLDRKLRTLKRPVEQVKEASEKVEKLADVGSSGATARGRDVVVKPPGILKQMFGTMQTVMLQLGVTLVLLFFLISSGDAFKMKLVASMRRYRGKKRVLCIWRDVEDNVSVYLLTITLINLCLGGAIAIGLFLMGFPNAALWGAMAALLNFIPYLGALVGLTVVAVVSIITYDPLGQAAIAPAIYLGCNIIESQLITPSVLGRRLSLNPVVVFISVIFWGWLWGMPGAMMAVPLLIIVHVLCTNFPRLRFIAEFLTLHSQKRDRRQRNARAAAAQ